MGKHSDLALPGRRSSPAARKTGLALPRTTARDLAQRLNAPRSAGPAGSRSSRRSGILPGLAFLAAFAFVLVLVVDPYSGAYADEATAPSNWVRAGSQRLVVQGKLRTNVGHDAYAVKYTAPVVNKPAANTASAGGAVPAAGTPDPGSAKAIAQQLVAQHGWSTNDYNCLVLLWNRESGWNVYAANPSGAYGIPQALPGSKMASAGPNWQSNAATQIKWGLSYIAGRYGTPCGAWAHSESAGWY